MLPPPELTKRERNQTLPPNQNTLAGGSGRKERLGFAALVERHKRTQRSGLN